VFLFSDGFTNPESWGGQNDPLLRFYNETLRLMIDERTHAGHTLATLGSVMLLSSAAAMAVTCGVAAYFNLEMARSIDSLLTTTPLPAALLLIFLATVGGTAASLIAIVLYGFRSRWFWRCLVIASAFWLFAVPMGSVLGMISLVVLLSTRKHFPIGKAPVLAAP